MRVTLRLIARVAGVGAAALGGVALGMTMLAFLIGTPRRIFNPRKSPARRGAACDDVTFAPRGGGPRLAAWSMPAPGAQRAIILTHGKDASRTAEFFGRFTELAGRLQALGFQVLMLDMRGHGQSEADGHTFGARERLDVLGAWDWLRSQGFDAGAIGLLGVSMGAAASIGALALDPEIRAVVADCGYADLPALIGNRWRALTRLPLVFALPGWWLAQRLAGGDLGEARPVRWMRTVDGRKVLVIHGDRDRAVPVQDAYALWAARPECDLWIVRGARHGGCYARDPDAYLNRVTGFFDARLG
ncbi:MAG: alpha/beta fold hydrolase [Thermoflexales bacterium]